MADFSEFTVSCYQPDCLTLHWEISDIPWGATYTVDVYRSESPTSGFDLIAKDITNRDVYHDWTVNLSSFTRPHYYKLVYKDSTDAEVTSEVEWLRNALDAEAADIVRRNLLALELYIGSPVFFLLRRSWGPHCPKCYNPDTHKTTMSYCDVCFGTSYADGFFEPIMGFITNAPPTKQLIFRQLYEHEPDIRTYWTSNYPVLKPNDILVNNMNERWMIKRIQLTQKMGAVLRQIFSAVQIPKSDVIYRVDVPQFGTFIPERDYHYWEYRTPEYDR